MSNKDFLSQFSDENKKPDSFKEEVRIPVQKPKKPIKPIMIIIPVVAVLLIAVLAWFFFLRPTIEVPNFVGKTQTDVAQWVTQQGIEKNGIIFDEEFSMEYDDGQIISQTISAGTKVKKDVKINFVMSKGADPDEKISVPDLVSMTKDELNTWKSENKLTNTKITTSYSDTVETDKVISISYRGCEADSFTRGCTLNISVSKGPAPAGTVTVNDFKNNALSSVETWADTNKVKVKVVHAFDETIASGAVISTSPEANKTMKQGDTITVVVSQGKGVKVPDFSKMANKQVDEWLEKNAAYAVVERRYANQSGYIIKQNVKAGAMVGTEDKLEVTLNQGNSFYLSDLQLDAKSIVGMQYEKLVDWCNNNRYLGIDAYTGQWGTNTEVYSETYSKGQIVSVECHRASDGKVYNCNERLPLDVRFSVVISKGRVVDIDISSALVQGHPDVYETSALVDILSSKGITFINNATGLTCTLDINGSKPASSAIRIKVEEDTVVLGASDTELPAPTTTPKTSPDSGENTNS